ncbi:MAG: methionyl-tRNA formyltransferase [Bacteroidetes bacterium]|nr:methionyl-tRNA formyltransferase [Bacteroidota bacterium]MDF2450869.1 methionyl-tRNA formyltransferase [Bacteroidota bacterium]
MRIIFMGTPEFAVASLDILIQNNYDVVAVVTVPDKPAGRGQQIQQSAVKKYALEKGLKVLQPEKLKDESFINELIELKADLQIVVAFRMLPEVVWNMPPLGTYNLHGSLLPKYRGAAPINWAVINGETESGVTSFKLKHEIDTGSMLFQEKVPIGKTTTAGELHDALMHVGAELILKTVKVIESGNYELKPQDDSQSIHAPKLFKETCKIKWNNPVEKIYNLIRGLSPYPAAFTEFIDKNNQSLGIKIFSSDIEEANHSQTPGDVLSDGKTFLKVACSNGFIHIKELQMAGKKRMLVEEFLRGFKAEPGLKFL